MASNHEEYLLANKEAMLRESTLACQRWMTARDNHPLYANLSPSRTTPEDQLLLKKIHEDIKPLHTEFLRVLALRTKAWDEYYDFVQF